MKGWFDAFRTEGGPTLYPYSNRTSVTGDLPIITICLIFLTIFVAFVIIFPGVRKERITTFLTVTLSLLTGTIICVCNHGSDWHSAKGEITSSYRAFSHEKIHAQLGVAIGLDHANVTLRVYPSHNMSLDINFNERFTWIKSDDMVKHYRNALIKGLPYPILTVAEYLSLNNEGFAWGRHYRVAGYYTSITLWASFATWILTNILLLNVPRYGAYMMMVTGLLMDLSCLLFYSLRPPKPLHLRFEDADLEFGLGWNFYMVLVVGTIIASYGLIVSIIEWINPHIFSTILEIDFDTPYDRHIIIEDSTDTRKRRFKIPRLEEPLNAGLTAGSRLLRRLSKRGGGKDPTDDVQTQPQPGVDNYAFEMETPKSPKTPWRNSIMMRTDSKKSTKSVNFRNASTRSQHYLDIPTLPKGVDDDKQKQFQRTDSKQSSISISSVTSSPKSVNFEENENDIPPILRQDSSSSCTSSSSSSIGLGGLTRNSSVRKISQEEIVHEPVARSNSANIIVFHRTDSRGQLQRLTGEVVEIQTDDSTDIW